MKCRHCRIQMTAQGDDHTCPSCGRVVALRDAGYAPLLEPEPLPSPFRPLPSPAAQAVFDAIDAAEGEPEPADDAPDVCPPEILARLRAAVDAAGVGANRYPPKRCHFESCGEWFIPLSGNARYCKTKTPTCADRADLSKTPEARRAATQRRKAYSGASFSGRGQ